MERGPRTVSPRCSNCSGRCRLSSLVQSSFVQSLSSAASSLCSSDPLLLLLLPLARSSGGEASSSVSGNHQQVEQNTAMKRTTHSQTDRILHYVRNQLTRHTYIQNALVSLRRYHTPTRVQR